MTHRQVYQALTAAGIGVNLHYIPVYLQPYYQQMGFRAGYCTQAEQYYSEVITIPLYPGLTESQQQDIYESLRSTLSSY